MPGNTAIEGKEFPVRYELQWRDDAEQDRFFQTMIDKEWISKEVAPK